jgi:hypothetical protein
VPLPRHPPAASGRASRGRHAGSGPAVPTWRRHCWHWGSARWRPATAVTTRPRCPLRRSHQAAEILADYIAESLQQGRPPHRQSGHAGVHNPARAARARNSSAPGWPLAGEVDRVTRSVLLRCHPAGAVGAVTPCCGVRLHTPPISRTSPGADRARDSGPVMTCRRVPMVLSWAKGVDVAGIVPGLGADSRTLTSRPACWYVSAVAAGRGVRFAISRGGTRCGVLSSSRSWPWPLRSACR